MSDMLQIAAATKLLVAVSALCLGAVTVGAGVTTHVTDAADGSLHGNANADAAARAATHAGLDAKAKAAADLKLPSLGCGCDGNSTSATGKAGADAKAKLRTDDALESAAHAAASGNVQAGDASADARAALKVSDDATEQNTHAAVQSGDNRVGVFNGLDVYPEQGQVLEHSQTNTQVGSLAEVHTKAVAEADVPAPISDAPGLPGLCGC